MLEWAETGELQRLVSPLHLVECLGRRPNQPVVGKDPAQQVEEILASGPVTLVESAARVALRARRLRLEKVIKPVADSIHLAHAIVGRAEVFFTLDADDFPLDRSIDGVYVSKPYMLGDQDLLTQDG